VVSRVRRWRKILKIKGRFICREEIVRLGWAISHRVIGGVMERNHRDEKFFDINFSGALWIYRREERGGRAVRGVRRGWERRGREKTNQRYETFVVWRVPEGRSHARQR
jgi:hypothetical protein